MTIDGKEYSNEELSRATEMLEKLDKSGYEYTTLGREKYLIDNFIPKDKIREVKQYLEYYLIGNLKYENCQNEFKKILKLLEEG